MTHGRHRVRRLGRGTLVLLVVLGLLVVGTAGTAVAAFRYDRARTGTILPGITIDGIAVGDMTRAQAMTAVTAAVKPRLDRSITVTAGSRTWQRTAASLGASADVEASVDEALALTSSFSWPSRVYHRWTDEPVARSFEVPIRYDPGPVQTFVTQAWHQVGTPARDASFTLVNGEVQMVHARSGIALARAKAATALAAAVTAGQASASLPVVKTAPKVPDAKLGKTIVVNVSRNMLYLYQGFTVIRSYPVATAMQGFVTPDGAWQVVNKAVDPTWVNPAPNGWGAGEPKMIGPGPNDPLGTRALYLSAPAILIHGTPADWSIGTYASHGCIRMHISQSEALYPLVPIGTPVFIVGAPPWGLTTNPGPAG
jgi:lipoprotein-anchoring transpeptidase ErfK/SrfK